MIKKIILNIFFYNLNYMKKIIKLNLKNLIGGGYYDAVESTHLQYIPVYWSFFDEYLNPEIGGHIRENIRNVKNKINDRNRNLKEFFYSLNEKFKIFLDIKKNLKSIFSTQEDNLRDQRSIINRKIYTIENIINNKGSIIYQKERIIQTIRDPDLKDRLAKEKRILEEEQTVSKDNISELKNERDNLKFDWNYCFREYVNIIENNLRDNKKIFIDSGSEKHAITFLIDSDKKKITLINSGFGIDVHEKSEEGYNLFKTMNYNDKEFNKIAIRIIITSILQYYNNKFDSFLTSDLLMKEKLDDDFHEIIKNDIKIYTYLKNILKNNSSIYYFHYILDKKEFRTDEDIEKLKTDIKLYINDNKLKLDEFNSDNYYNFTKAEKVKIDLFLDNWNENAFVKENNFQIKYLQKKEQGKYLMYARDQIGGTCSWMSLFWLIVFDLINSPQYIEGKQNYELFYTLINDFKIAINQYKGYLLNNYESHVDMVLKYLFKFKYNYLEYPIIDPIKTINFYYKLNTINLNYENMYPLKLYNYKMNKRGIKPDNEVRFKSFFVYNNASPYVPITTAFIDSNSDNYLENDMEIYNRLINFYEISYGNNVRSIINIIKDNLVNEKIENKQYEKLNYY